MTKLCARGKSAAKRKFKVYPSAYANAYASKICAGKIKDPSGTKRKDWGPKKAFLGGLMKTKDKKKEEIKKQETVFDKAKKDKKTKQQRLEEMKKELGMNKGGGADMSTMKKKKKKPAPGGGRERHEYMKNIQNPISEYGPKGKLKYTGAKVGMNVTAGGQSALGRLEKSGMRGGGIAIKGTNFKGVF